MDEAKRDPAKLRKTKAFRALELKSNGFSIEEIAVLLYMDRSKNAQGCVRSLISYLKRRERREGFRFLGSKFSLQGARARTRTHHKLAPYEKLSKRPIKNPETVEKGKAGETVDNWQDEDKLARQLADECYENAKQCVLKREFDDACRFLELVSRFLKLSQSAKKEFDLQQLKEIALKRGLDDSAKKEFYLQQLKEVALKKEGVDD